MTMRLSHGPCQAILDGHFELAREFAERVQALGRSRQVAT